MSVKFEAARGCDESRYFVLSTILELGQFRSSTRKLSKLFLSPNSFTQAGSAGIIDLRVEIKEYLDAN